MKSKLILGAGGAVIAVIAILAMTLITAGIVSAQTPTNTPSTSSAPAAPAAGSPVHLKGKISTVSPNSIVLTTRKGDITANTSSNTYIVVQKNGAAATGATSDLVVGENANVVGEATADATVVDAKLISQGGPFGNRPGLQGEKRGGKGFDGYRMRGTEMLQHAAAGTITSINGDFITLQGNKVPVVNVNTSANTLILNNGFTSLSTLKVGDRVEVLGVPVRPANGTSTQPAQSRTINAWAVRVDDGSTKVTMAHVATVSGSTVTTNARKNTGATTINFDSNTKLKTLTITLSAGANTFSFADASQSDVQANSNIVVEGVASADGTSITAQAVIILPSRGAFNK